jgi:7-cyano-7-deazaguanine reductase
MNLRQKQLDITGYGKYIFALLVPQPPTQTAAVNSLLKLFHGIPYINMFKKNMVLLDDAVAADMLPALSTVPCPVTLAACGGVVRIIFPEFTCLCPRTGYPDFASIDLYYLPHSRCIELKSWKLYLNSFRMVGTFHETVTGHLFQTVKKLLQPEWLLLVGDFFPRGNVNTTVALETPVKRPAGADILIKKYLHHARSFEPTGKGKGPAQ